MIVKFKLLRNEAIKPKKAHPDDAGFDVFSSINTIIPAKGNVDIPTGVAMQLPHGFYGKFASRSGLAMKHDVHCFHGTIDNGYRGEMVVRLFNYSTEPFQVNVGDRIAQLVILPYLIADGIVVDELEDTQRGANGFGSTGGIANATT